MEQKTAEFKEAWPNTFVHMVYAVGFKYPIWCNIQYGVSFKDNV